MSVTDDNVIVTEDNLRVVFDDVGGFALAEALLAGEVVAAVTDLMNRTAEAGDELAQLQATKVLLELLGRLMKPKRNVVLQNRDRSTPAMIAQMTQIAGAPDYYRVAPTKEFASGTPIVFGNDDALPASIALGRKDKAVAADGRRFQVQYAVVEAADLLTSNTADGLAVADYTNGAPGKLRAIAGNGRLAGLKAGFERGTAGDYVQELTEDDAHGIAADDIAKFTAPILVRVMRAEDVTENIGDISNQKGTSDLSPVEQAQNDSKRLDLADLDVSDDGKPTESAALAFIAAMPEAERNNLMDGKHPGQKAYDRLMAAVFWKAYADPELVRLYAQSVDSEIKTIMGGMASAAGELARLDGAGELDIRAVVTEAASLAINAKRQGVKLAEFAKQTDMTLSPDTMEVVRMFAENIRSAKKIGERLRATARFAYEEFTKEDTDMFGAVEKATREQVLARLSQEPESSLFDAVDPLLALQLTGQLVTKTAALKAAEDDPLAALGLSSEILGIIRQLTEEAAAAPAAPPQPDPVAWKNLRTDILGSIAAIVGIDRGTMPGMDRSLFVSSIAGKIRRANDRGDTALAGTALAFVAETQEKFTKPVFAPANKLWKDVDWKPYLSQVESAEEPAAPAPEAPKNGRKEFVDAMTALKPFMSTSQFQAIKVAGAGEEAQFFYDKMAEMAGVVGTMPKTYEQDGKGDQAIVYLHYFRGGADWYITEKDKTGNGTQQAFGLADLGQGYPELGYIGIDELVRAGVELDLHWEPKTLAQVQGKAEPAAQPEPEPAAAPEPATTPEPNEPDMQKMEAIIKQAADSIATLRRIDVYRVLAAAGERHIGSTLRSDLATYIVTNRPDLLKEVTDVMAEEFPDVAWGAAPAEPPAAIPQPPAQPLPPGAVELSPSPAAPADLSTEPAADLAPANPERAADMAYLQGVVAQSVDMWADDLADKLEAIVAKYPGDVELEAAWREAVNAYTNFMVKELAKA